MILKAAVISRFSELWGASRVTKLSKVLTKFIAFLFFGAELWTQRYRTADSFTVLNRGQGVAVSADGVYMVGALRYLVGFLLTTDDAFVRKYDKDGSEIWGHEFGTRAR